MYLSLNRTNNAIRRFSRPGLHRAPRLHADPNARRRLPAGARALRSRRGMNLARGLAQREAEGRPIRVGLIGAGKFGTMILAQLRLMAGVRLCVLADLDPDARAARRVEAGWDGDAFARRGDRRRGERPRARRPRRARRQRRARDGVRAGRADRSDRARRSRRAARVPRDRARAARRDGDRRSGRRHRPVPAPHGGARGRRLLDGVRRPAGDHLRARRLGAHVRLRGRRPRARARSSRRATGARRPTPRSRTTASRRSRSRPAASTPRCSTRSSTARSRRSRWSPSRTRRGSTSRTTGCRSRPRRCTICRRCCEPQRGRRHPAARRDPRRRLVHHARREVRRRPPALGRVRDVHVRERLREAVLRRVRHRDRSERTVRGAVAAVSPDRAGDRRVDRVGGAARRADGRAVRGPSCGSRVRDAHGAARGRRRSTARAVTRRTERACPRSSRASGSWCRWVSRTG